MMIDSWLVLAGLSSSQLGELLRRIPADPRRGRPHGRPLAHRVLLTCAALRTNLTVRELAALADLPRATLHRIIATMTPRLAAVLSSPSDRRFAWVVDGTLIPTRDHRHAAKAKNYRWSCNAQILIRRRDLAIIATTAGGPGNRNDTVHYRGSRVEALCRAHGRVLADGGYRGVPELRTPRFRHRRIVRDRAWRIHRKRRARVEHAIARLKNWRVLRDHRRRGAHLDDTLRAVCALHNLRIELRDNP